MGKTILSLAACTVLAFFATAVGSCESGIVQVPSDCIPDCGVRVCGPVPNGCGESCGDCESSESCDISSGRCEACAPDCSGRECGPDPQNCGFSCGICSLPGQHCDLATGRCQTCSPDCGVRVCGGVPNGCGESCGSCTDPDQNCNETTGLCDSCSPDCGVRVCGPVPNGCGESCGSCKDPEWCDIPSGRCQACAPDCGVRVCGPVPNGCGESCGSCTLPGQNCNPITGRCEGCSPDCGGRVCGPVPNGCGESCGSCEDPEWCDISSGQCEACAPDCGVRVCGPVPNGCGESCGTCENPQTCDLPNGRCVDPQNTCTHFVDGNNGNNTNSGASESQAWRTIQHAADVAMAGNTVCVKSGTYFETLSITRSGSAGSYITFVSYPERTATIDGEGKNISEWNGLVRLSGASYLKISGFNIVNATGSGANAGAGIMVTSDYGSPPKLPTGIVIEKNHIENTTASAILVEQGVDLTIDGNEITKADANQPSQEIVSIIGANGFEIKNNRLYDNFCYESINLKGGSSNGTVHHNDIQPTQSAGIYMDAWDDVESNIEVFSNVIHDGTGSSRGIAVAVECGGRIEHIRIFNNIVYNNGAHGIMIANYSNCDPYSCCIGGPIDDVQITNNTVYHNDYAMGWGGGIVNDDDRPDATNIVIRNNIVSQNNRAQIRAPDTNTIVEYNLIDGSGGINGAQPVFGDPLFVNPSAGDFHIQVGSPAIDSGTTTAAPATDFDGQPRPKGAGYDIGAYEYGAGTLVESWH